MDKKHKKPRHCKSEELKGLYFRNCLLRNALLGMGKMGRRNKAMPQKKANG